MGNLEWNPGPALAKIYEDAASGATAAATAIASTAKGNAPQRKKRTSGRNNPLQVKPRAPSEFRTPEDRTRAAEIRAHPGAVALGESEARFFRVTSGEFKGQSPETLIETKRGGIRGAISPETARGGGLKKGIHAVPAEVDGQRVIAHVRSEAPYSRPVEQGFHHFPDGKQIKGQFFMRRAIDAHADDWRSGSFIKKKG